MNYHAKGVDSFHLFTSWGRVRNTQAIAHVPYECPIKQALTLIYEQTIIGSQKVAPSVPASMIREHEFNCPDKLPEVVRLRSALEWRVTSSGAGGVSPKRRHTHGSSTIKTSRSLWSFRNSGRFWEIPTPIPCRKTTGWADTLWAIYLKHNSRGLIFAHLSRTVIRVETNNGCRPGVSLDANSKLGLKFYRVVTFVAQLFNDSIGEDIL